MWTTVRERPRSAPLDTIDPCNYHVWVVWEIEGTDEFAEWFGTLDAPDQEQLGAAISALERVGPALGRPFVDTIKGSRHSNMKELRPRSGNIRVFFAFDPRRMAILLVGGDKTNRWQAFYAEMLPIADDLYDAHLAELQREGLL